MAKGKNPSDKPEAEVGSADQAPGQDKPTPTTPPIVPPIPTPEEMAALRAFASRETENLLRHSHGWVITHTLAQAWPHLTTLLVKLGGEVEAPQPERMNTELTR